MTKRVGLVLIILGILIAAAYAVVALTSFGISEKQLYSGQPAPDYAPIELSYNNVTYTSGAIEYSVQASFDVDRLNPDNDPEKSTAITNAANAIRTAFEERGYIVSEGGGSEFIKGTIISAGDLTELDIIMGNDGYDVGTSSAKVERGFWNQDYIIPVPFPFDGAEDSVLTAMTAAVSAIPGVSASDVDTVYNYGSYYSTKTIESNADYVYYLNNGTTGSYVHEFRVNLSEEPGDYYLVQHAPNTVSAYLILIVFALVACGTVLFVSGSRKRL